jgi:basic membrane protein A
MTPGTNRCGGGTPTYQISVIFSPGDYFAAALQPFGAGTLRVGVARVWHMGKDPVPSVKICNPTGDQQAKVDAVIKQIGSGAIKPDDLVGKA